MLYDVVEDPGSLTPDQLRAEYDAALADAITDTGVDAVVDAVDVEESVVRDLARGESPELTLREAAEILAAAGDVRDAETMVLEIRDQLLMGMTTGVVDVDTIAANIEPDLTGQEVQQALEGRTRMRLDELAAIHQFIAARQR